MLGEIDHLQNKGSNLLNFFKKSSKNLRSISMIFIFQNGSILCLWITNIVSLKYENFLSIFLFFFLFSKSVSVFITEISLDTFEGVESGIATIKSPSRSLLSPFSEGLGCHQSEQEPKDAWVAVERGHRSSAIDDYASHPPFSIQLRPLDLLAFSDINTFPLNFKSVVMFGLQSSRL